MLLFLLALGACAQPLAPYVAPTEGATARLLMRAKLESGEGYGVFVLGGAEDCSRSQRVGIGTSTSNPPATTVPSGKLSTIDVFVTKPNRTTCRVRWSFLPVAKHSYVVSARSTSGGCSAVILDATNPDAMKPEASMRRRDSPVNACLPLSGIKTYEELSKARDFDMSRELPLPAAGAASAARGNNTADDDLKGLTGS